ncbi:tape measure protein [Acinetobacter guillouiae]|uniref:tape measure protein n=1 Tax=Acinetobacter guillouiae TaxID=106649 RepID=UPI002E1B6BEA
MAEQRSTLIIEISSEQAARNARALDRELQSIERTGNYATTSMNSMSVAARQLAGYLAGVVTVGTAIAKMDDWTNLNNRLRLVTTNQKALNVAMQDTFDIAQRSGAAWGGTATIYQKIQYNSEKLGLSQEKVAKITESISKSISNSGSSAQAASAALYQLGQSFDKSSLNGDEFVSMSENAGYLMEVFAKGLGVTRGELKEMSSQGLLTTDKMVQAIEKMSGSIEGDFGKTNFTIGQSFTQLSNAVTKFVGESGQATGAASTISGSLSLLAENLNTVTNIAMIGGAYWLGTYIPALYTSTMAGYGKIKQLTEQTAIQYAAIQAERIAAAQELTSAEARVVSTQATLAAIAAEKALEVQRLKEQINSIGRTASITRMAQLRRVETQVTAELTLAQNALATSQSRVNAAQNMSMGVGRGLLGILGGPVGLGLTVAAVAGSYLMLKDSTKDTTTTLDLQKSTVSELVEEYSKLDELQKRTTLRELEKQVKSLATSYTVAYSDLSAMIGWLEESGSVSESTAREINKLFKEYNKGKISSSEFATAVNNLSGVQKKHKVEIDELTTAHAKANAEYKKVKTAQQALTNQTSSAIKANKDETDSILLKKKALEESKKAYDSYKSGAFDDIKEMAARAKLQSMGQSDALIEQNLKVLKALNFDPLKTKTPYAQEMFKVADISAKMKEKEDSITQAKKDQTKELEKQLKVLQVNEKVKANAAKYNFGGLESKYGLLLGLLSGVHMQESRGKADAVGPMTKYGTAKGGFQFLDDTAKRFKLTGGDVFDLGKSAEAAAKYLQILYKKFGSWDKAISAYHAGEGNVDKGTNIGPVNRQYVQNIKGYIAGTNGFEGSTKDFDTSVNDLVKFFQVKQDIELQYSNGEIQRRTEHEKKLADIQSHFSGETYTKLERQENERFANENRIAELQFDSNVKGWNWAEDQKLKHQAEVNRIQISLSTELNDIQKQLAKESIDDQLAYELKEFKKVQDIKRQTAFDNINNPIYSMRDKGVEAQAQVSMTPVQYQTWQLNKVQQDGYVGLGSDLIDSANAINENQILSEQEKYDQLKSAHEDYVNSKASLDLLYDKQTKDLARSQQEEQINMWGGILSTTQNTFSQLAQSAKDGAGEQSSVYRTMFAMQQAFSIASSMVAAYTAYSTAFADPSAMTLTQKFAGGAAVMAALMPAITSISSISLKGMAHNGIDNIPSEGTWLLDGGERVLNPQQNKDLTNYLANSKSQGPNIVINNNGSSKVSATQGADGKTYITIDELPGLIAGQLRNPNSQISKSVQHNTTATRRR